MLHPIRMGLNSEKIAEDCIKSSNFNKSYVTKKMKALDLNNLRRRGNIWLS